MGTILLITLISTVLGVLPTIKEKGTALRLAIIYFIFGFIIFYFALPSLNYPLGGGVAWMTLLFLLVTAVVRGTQENEFPKLPSLSLGLGCTVMVIVLIGSCGAFQAEKYSALIGPVDKGGKTLKHWTQQTEELSPTHVRIIPLEHAMSIGKTSLNQHADDQGNIVTSQFQLSEDHATLQKVEHALYWVIPLDYISWGSYKWTAGVPGFVIVNAEDRNQQPKYLNGYKMIYTPGAFFGNDLERYLYSKGYYNKVMRDFLFEIDDDFKPYWVVSICEQTIGYGGAVVEGVVLVDPENGQFTYYEKNKAPAWIDRIIPESVVQDNINSWGKWSKGFWNTTSVGSQSNVREAEATTLNYGVDNTCWYVTPVRSSVSTANDKKDHSMTDLIYTNSRTGESIRYSVSGSTEEAIINTINTTVGYQHLHATSVVYENVDDRLTALTPILAEDHSLRGLALVDVTTKNMAWDPNPMDALMKYQNLLESGGTAAATDIATRQVLFAGIVDRVNLGVSSSGSTYYLYFKEKNHIFMVTSDKREILVTQKGDSVSIGYLDTPSDLVATNQFDNLNLNISGSKNQQEMRERMKEGRKEDYTDKTRESMKNSIRNNEISGDVLDSLIDNYLKIKK